MVAIKGRRLRNGLISAEVVIDARREEEAMTERYKVIYCGAKCRIIKTPTGEWARWNQARFAAIDHIEENLAEAQAALDSLRRSGNYAEYTMRQAASCRE